MKKSTYIDYAVLMAVRSHKSKKKNEPLKELAYQAITETDDLKAHQTNNALTAAIVVEVFTYGLTA